MLPKIDVIRDEFMPTCIRGRLLVDGREFCQSLELPDNRNAVGASCIPTGSYQLRLSRSQRFGRLLPELLAVPDRTAIRIHAGNGPGDSSGCILVGEVRGLFRGMPGLLRGRNAENLLVAMLLERIGRDGRCWINVVERRS
ncbi:MAG: DUF5675 family protein [Desulfovibrionaceae bacterium]